MIINGKNHDKPVDFGTNELFLNFRTNTDQCFLWVSASESEDWLCLKIG